MSKSSCVILFSSGLDSTVNLYKAVSELDVKLAITINYGQKAFAKELEQSQKICEELGVSHKRVAVSYTHLRAHGDQRGSRMPSSA